MLQLQYSFYFSLIDKASCEKYKLGMEFYAPAYLLPI